MPKGSVGFRGWHLPDWWLESGYSPLTGVTIRLMKHFTPPCKALRWTLKELSISCSLQQVLIHWCYQFLTTMSPSGQHIRKFWWPRIGIFQPIHAQEFLRKLSSGYMILLIILELRMILEYIWRGFFWLCFEWYFSFKCFPNVALAYKLSSKFSGRFLLLSAVMSEPV